MGEYLMIDAHSHLWLHQDTVVDGQHIYALPNGRAMFFGEEVQMLPPFITDGRNTAEIFLSNMNYARVAAAVVTQEFIDGPQNDYLEEVVRNHPDRFFVFGMPEWRKPGYYEEGRRLIERGFKGLKLPAARLIDHEGRKSFTTDEAMRLFHYMEDRGILLGIELAEGDTQVGEMETVIEECPRLRVVIGHFGMVNRPHWESQLRLALHENVYIESGGITWLYNDEFYPFPSAVRAIRQAIDTVGIEKLMWGSDYPRTITAITYKMSFDFICKSDLLTESEKACFLGGNAKRLFGFGPLPSLPYIKNMSE
jgi:predicted TIM-barrel fold metal-dependent hydrolase